MIAGVNFFRSYPGALFAEVCYGEGHWESSVEIAKRLLSGRRVEMEEIVDMLQQVE